VHFGFLPAGSVEAVLRRIRALSPTRIGLTGCGAAALSEQLDRPSVRVVEFDAWGRGSRELLSRQHESEDEDAPYLLVSLGTGTSVLKVEGDRTSRLGGSALGGGTVLGLGVALTGCASFEELCKLARGGRRGNVDLLVSDIYRPGEVPIPGEATAASFGNLARWLTPGRDAALPAHGDPSQREDLASSVMGLVGENVALISCGHSTSVGIDRIVYGGATLHDNPALVAVLMGVTAGLGRKPVLLEDGGYAGALGALARAADDD
jgi:type II pantothenate kinase